MGDDYQYNDNTYSKDERICMIYDHTDFFTVFVQMLLSALALASLWIKRQQEEPKRKFNTWIYDVTKQGAGAVFAHVMNMVIAAILVNNTRGETVLEDQCAWYGISYLIDTTLGLVVAIMFLRLLDDFANKYNWEKMQHVGVYTGPDAFERWIYQTVAWLVILSIVKVLIYLFMWVFSDMLAFVGGLAFAPFQFDIRFELLFVMILFPGVLNIVYFWIADSYLMAHSDHTDAFEDENEEISKKKETLLTDDEKKSASSQQPLSQIV